MITEPRWKSYIVETTKPIFSPRQCKMIIEAGREEPKITAQVGGTGEQRSGVLDTKTRTSHISWIPFKKMNEMYKDIEKTMKKTNGNHFGFDDVQITELAQYTEYPTGGFMLAHILPIIGSLSNHSCSYISCCILNNSVTKGLNTGI